MYCKVTREKLKWENVMAKARESLKNLIWRKWSNNWNELRTEEGNERATLVNGVVGYSRLITC